MASDCGNVQKVFVPVDNEKKKEVAKEIFKADAEMKKHLMKLLKENRTAQDQVVNA